MRFDKRSTIRCTVCMITNCCCACTGDDLLVSDNPIHNTSTSTDIGVLVRQICFASMFRPSRKLFFCG